ncbi:MAG TPA: alpha/beta hydrolase [Flavisolibacter sp.]|jgi:pimeloyl-ACP methyl ester carboxylesterase|nr:alpha/beta hydrolase [Flavisolibacter sp.]
MTLVQRLGLKFIRTKLAVLSRVSKKSAAKKAFELFITPQSRVRQILPPAFQKAEKLNFLFEGITIHGYRFNHPSEKKVVILHGFESSIINFDKYIAPLQDKGYEILGFDAPGHGASGGKTINAINYKNFIHHIIKTYGPVTSFITHSYGGLALSLALEETQHDGSWKVVFMAPATESTTAMNNFFSLLQLDGEVRKEFDLLITRANNKPPEWYSLSRVAAGIKAQVLFLQDKNDTLTPLSDVAPIMAKGYSNFEFIITEGLGHSRIYRDPGTIRSVISFL